MRLVWPCTEAISLSALPPHPTSGRRSLRVDYSRISNCLCHRPSQQKKVANAVARRTGQPISQKRSGQPISQNCSGPPILQNALLSHPGSWELSLSPLSTRNSKKFTPILLVDSFSYAKNTLSVCPAAPQSSCFSLFSSNYF